MWNRAEVEPGAQGLAYYFTALDYYRRAIELFPVSGVVTFQYAEALKGLGNGLINAGRVDDGRRLVNESREMYVRADLLARYTELVR